MKNVSLLLKEKRLALNLSLKEVEHRTRISIALLEQIESGSWNKFGSFAYLQGVIKKYAAFLGMDQSKIISYLKREHELEPAQFIRKTDYEEGGRQLPANWYLYLIIFLVILFFGIQFFLAWQKPLLVIKPVPRQLKVTTPLLVSGKTQSGVLLYLNDQQIYQDEQGKFQEELYFKSKGSREIVIRAIGANGKEEQKRFIVEVK